MDDTSSNLAMLIGVGIPIGLILICLGNVLYTQLQASIMEMFVTLTVSTIPLGLILQEPNAHFMVSERIAVGLFPMVLFFAGSLWGLSICRRMKEQDGVKRIGFIVLGWFMVAGVVVVPVMFGYCIKDPDDSTLCRTQKLEPGKSDLSIGVV